MPFVFTTLRLPEAEAIVRSLLSRGGLAVIWPHNNGTVVTSDELDLEDETTTARWCAALGHTPTTLPASTPHDLEDALDAFDADMLPKALRLEHEAEMPGLGEFFGRSVDE